MIPKILSIYLPQFHRIPENDAWWGEGFTEWTNVKRGKPLYSGHYQPREPLNNDYYDLSDLAVLERHSRMARKAGIYGFCFYHYYFKGKKLLEKPIENYRDNSKEKFPYCLIWANQSWTRTWYRANKGNKVLINQDYGNKDDWEKQFYYLLDFFRDDRYIKIDGKPVYIIYLPQDIPLRRQMFSLWRKLAVQNGFKGLYLIAMDTWAKNDPKENLYDAFMNFEPLHSFKNDNSYRKLLYKWKDKCITTITEDTSRFVKRLLVKNMYTYSFLCRKISKLSEKVPNRKTFLGVFPGWDNTSRKDEEGWVVKGSTPHKFGKSVENALEESQKRGNEFIFINAWNEWSEGAYIEPDKKYGYAYLHEIRRAVEKCNHKVISKKEPVLLITASIEPQDVRYLRLCNARQRLEQYIDSLKYYIQDTNIKKIVFCDNSNYDFDKKEIFSLAKKYGKSVEIIQFNGNKYEIAKCGKGYGEGEIIKYALENSDLLLNADYFIKITGRLKVKNIDEIKEDLDYEKMYFNKSMYVYQAIDTIFYCLPKKEYVKWFISSYTEVCDKKDIFLEKIFDEIVSDNHLTFYNIPRYPVIDGISGTGGVPYQENMWAEIRFYDILSRRGLFNCNWIYNSLFYILKNKANWRK